MKNFQIKCGDCYFTISGDSISWSIEGLKVYLGTETIAMFTTWDYWMVQDETK